jgi:hypothetical protein
MIIKAILKLNPNAEVSVSGNDINTIVWENAHHQYLRNRY